MVSFLKKLLGTKSERDVKEIMPILDNIHKAYEIISNLSNDQLRAKTLEFKEKITNYIASEENQISELKNRIEAESEMEIDEKEHLYQTIDKLEKESYKKSQEILNEILPEAFAVMKETAKRFKENEIVEVTATEMDKDIAAKRDHVILGFIPKFHWNIKINNR